MKLNNEQMVELTELAGACMKTREICLIMQLDHDSFLEELQNPVSPVFIAHQTGFLRTKVEVQKKLIDLAKAGSSPAQTATLKLILDKELDDEG